MTPLEMGCVLGTLFLASTVRSAIGFGMGLIAMPLLGFFLDVQEATPLINLLAVAMSVFIVARDRHRVDWKAVRSLGLGLLMGIPAGVLLLAHAPREPILNALACVVIAFALFRLFWRRPLPLRPNLGWDLSLGFLSGSFSAAFGIGGPPLIAYAMLLDWDPPTFRATLHALALASGIFVIGGHGIAGLWTPDVLRLFAYGIPAMLAGLVIGRKLNRVLDREIFRTAVYVVLLVLGVLLLAT